MDHEEISDKIRKAIKAKLTELGCYIDDELPDYIMVMVANKKSMQQMSEDLDLFLGENAAPFTKWLDHLLTRLQAVTKSVTRSAAKQPTAAEEKHTGSTKSEEEEAEPDDEQGEELTLHAQDDEFEDDVEYVESAARPAAVTAASPAARVKREKTATAAGHDQNSSQTASTAAKKTVISTRGDSEVLLPQATVHPSRRQPDKPPARRLSGGRLGSPPSRHYSHSRSRSPQSKRSPLPRRRSGGSYRASPEDRRRNTSEYKSGGRYDRDRLRTADTRDIRDRRARDYPPRDRAEGRLSSRIGNINQSRDGQETILLSESEDEEYNPTKPQVGSVASIIKVTERKSSIPLALQANKKLLLKAMSDITKTQAVPKPEVVRVEKSPSPQRRPAKQRIGRTSRYEESRDSRSRPARGRVDRSVSRSRSRSRSRSLTDYVDEEDLLEVLTELKARKQLRLRMKERVEERGTVEQVEKTPISERLGKRLSGGESPRFVVTLDAVTDMNKVYPNAASINETADEDLLDDSHSYQTEEVDEAAARLDEESLSSNTVVCRYIPFCTAGDACPYLHPVCKNYPNCKFGNSCGYKHPKPSPSEQKAKAVPCRFGASCTRLKCPYDHTTSSTSITNIKPASVAQTVCKFFPKCSNMTCPYLHPKPCKFGIACLNKDFGCKFSHPSLPTKQMLKWSKPSTTQIEEVSS